MSSRHSDDDPASLIQLALDQLLDRHAPPFLLFGHELELLYASPGAAHHLLAWQRRPSRSLATLLPPQVHRWIEATLPSLDPGAPPHALPFRPADSALMLRLEALSLSDDHTLFLLTIEAQASLAPAHEPPSIERLIAQARQHILLTLTTQTTHRINNLLAITLTHAELQGLDTPDAPAEHLAQIREATREASHHSAQLFTRTLEARHPERRDALAPPRLAPWFDALLNAARLILTPHVQLDPLLSPSLEHVPLRGVDANLLDLGLLTFLKESVDALDQLDLAPATAHLTLHATHALPPPPPSSGWHTLLAAQSPPSSSFSLLLSDDLPLPRHLLAPQRDGSFREDILQNVPSMAILERALTAHPGATLSLHVTPQAGATLRIDLPAPPDASRSEDASQEVTSTHCLLIDDEQSMLSPAERILRRHGYEVHCFTSPLLAIAALRRRQHRFAFALIDFSMTPLNGLETLHQLRDLQPDLPALITTGMLHRELEAQLELLPAADAIAKPWGMHELLAAISTLTGRDHPGSAQK